MKVVAVIPMKLNNQRFPGKNTKRLSSGKALCEYVLETFLQIPEIDEIYVYCSDDSIVSYLPQKVQYLKRSKELDQDNVSMSTVLKCFAEEVDADIYVMSHATAPFIEHKSIQKGLGKIISGDFDSAFSVKCMQDFMWKQRVPVNYDLSHIPRTQDLEPIFVETSGFYAYRNNVIKDMGRRIGKCPYLVEVNEIEAIDIDEEIDFLIADAVDSYMRGKKHE